MPHRDTRGGSFLLDVRVKGLGRIKRASGTTHRATFRELQGMVSILAGRADGRAILRALKARQYHPMQVLEAWRHGNLDSLPTPDTTKRLAEALPAYAEAIAVRSESDQHGKAMARAFNRLIEAAPERAVVADLDSLLRDMRLTTDRPSAFNHLRNYLRAYLRDHVGKRHPLYLAIKDIEPLDEADPRLAPYISVPDLGVVATGTGVPGQVWSLVTTGMRPGAEYLPGRWARQGPLVDVRGRKSRAARRIVPYVHVEAPTLGLKAFRSRLKDASQGRLQVYDLRRIFSRFNAELLGIPEARRGYYMGHAPRTVTGLYERSDAEPHVREDAEAWRRLLGEVLP